MKILEILDRAIDQNIDCDLNGNVSGKWFAIEQFLRDARNSRIKFHDRSGKPYDMAKAIEQAKGNQKWR